MAAGTTARTIAAAELVKGAETGEHEPPQYSTRKILTIWAAAVLPMGAAAWIAAPILATATGGTNSLPRALLVTLTVGLVWQSVLVAALVYREQKTLR